MIPVTLRVVKSAKLILLLGMDWHIKYAVTTNINQKTLDFTVQGQCYQIIIKFGRMLTIDNVECFSMIRVMKESSKKDYRLTLLKIPRVSYNFTDLKIE